MGKYVAGDSVLRLTGQPDAVQPGQPFEHDFSETGPDGEHGPARETALLAGGAITKAAEAAQTVAPAAADSPTTDDSARPRGRRSTTEG